MRATAIAAVFAAAACSPTVKQVQVDPPQAQLGAAKAPLVLHAHARDDKGVDVPDAKLVWSSSNPAVASVDATGKVTGLKSGLAEITAEAGEIKGVSRVRVEILNSLALNPAEVKLTGPEQTAQLHLIAKDDSGATMPLPTANWSSSNPKVVTVDGAGNIHSLMAGTATIAVHSGAMTGSAQVIVTPPPQVHKAASAKHHGRS